MTGNQNEWFSSARAVQLAAARGVEDSLSPAALAESSLPTARADRLSGAKGKNDDDDNNNFFALRIANK